MWGASTCGRQRRGCLVKAWGVPEEEESRSRSPSANILGSCRPCRSLGQSSTGTCSHFCNSQRCPGYVFHSNLIGCDHWGRCWVLLMHGVVKLCNSPMSPVFTELRKNLTKNIRSEGKMWGERKSETELFAEINCGAIESYYILAGTFKWCHVWVILFLCISNSRSFTKQVFLIHVYVSRKILKKWKLVYFPYLVMVPSMSEMMTLSSQFHR